MKIKCPVCTGRGEVLGRMYKISPVNTFSTSVNSTSEPIYWEICKRCNGTGHIEVKE